MSYYNDYGGGGISSPSVNIDYEVEDYGVTSSGGGSRSSGSGSSRSGSTGSSRSGSGSSRSGSNSGSGRSNEAVGTLPTENVKYDKGDCFNAFLVGSIENVEGQSVNVFVRNCTGKIFNLTSAQVKNFIENYTHDNEDSEVLINTVYLSDIISNIKTINETKNTVRIETSSGSKNNWKFTIGDDDSTISLNVKFRRPYVYSPAKANANKEYELINYKNTFNTTKEVDGLEKTITEDKKVKLKFNVINEPNSLSINYADVKDFLWFDVSAYNDIETIAVSVADSSDESSTKYFCLYKSNSAVLSNDIVNKQLNGRTDGDGNYIRMHQNNSLGLSTTGDKMLYGKNPVINIYNGYINETNSEFFYYYESTLRETTTHIKAYIPGILFGKGDDGKSITYEGYQYDTINVFIKFVDNGVNSYVTKTEAIANASAFQAFANTHCTLDYLNTRWKLHTKYNATSEDEQIIAIFTLNSGETTFNGSISVFYGNQIVYNESRKTEDPANGTFINASLTKPSGEAYTKNTLYYSVKNTGKALYVYIKTTQGQPFMLHKFVSIFLSDNGSTNKSKNTTHTVDYISQDDIVLHSVDVSIPQVSKGDSLVYIDDSFNGKTRHYTTYSALTVGDNTAYYGVRAYAKKAGENDSDNKYFDNELYTLGINDLSYNVNATIVKLNPIASEKSIYSFANGEQYVLLNKKAIKAEIVNNTLNASDILNGKEILSYEYQVDGQKKMPEYALLYAAAGDTIVNTNIKDFDKFSIEYAYNKEIPETYKQIVNISPNVPIDIDVDIYSYQFTEYLTQGEILEDNIWERIEEFVQVPSGNVDISKFKDIVRKSENSEAKFGEDKYYKYSASSKTYSPYKFSDIQKYNSVPLNLYVKHVYYVKTSEVKEDIKFGGNNPKRYKKNFGLTYIQTDVNETVINSKTKLFQQIGTSYIPFNGFVRDGSIDYYGFKLKPISEKKGELNNISLFTKDKINYQYTGANYISQGLNPKNIRIKTKYTPVREYLNTNNLSSIYELKGAGFTFYKRIDYIDYIEIESNKTIYDIDTTGNTIYASENSLSSLIKLSSIKSALKGIENSNYPDEVTILRSKPGEDAYQYRLTEFTITGQKIKYKVSFNGIYSEVLFNDISIKEDGSVPNDICVKNDSYTIPSSSDDIAALNNATDILLEYNTDDILFVHLFDKLTADDLSNKNYLIPVEFYYKYWYIYEDNIYPVIDDYALLKYAERYEDYTGATIKDHKYKIGFIKNRFSDPTDSNYFAFYTYGSNDNTYEKCYDIHMSANKEYFRKVNTEILTGKVTGGKNDIYIDTLNSVCYLSSNAEVDIAEISSPLKNLVNQANYNRFIELKEAGNTTDAEKEELNTLTNNFKVLNYSSLALFNTGVSYYELSELCTTLQDFNRSNTHINTNYKTDIENGISTYTDEIFIKTKFFYPAYTFNDGIHVDTNGSYYTNVTGFDTAQGKISKKVYLNNHIINADKYSYELSVPAFSSVNLNDAVKNPNEEYYIQYKVQSESGIDELGNTTYIEKEYRERLKNSSHPITYWFNTNVAETYTLVKKVFVTDEFEYNGLDNQLVDEEGNPAVFKLNDSLYGLVFNEPIDTTTYSDFVTFDKGYDYVKKSNILDIEGDPITLFNFDENDNLAEDKSEKTTKALITANDELYYNNYRDEDIKNCYIFNAKINHADYLYEIVPLSLFTFRNYNSDKSLLQYKDIVTHSITSSKPFTIQNSEEVIFTGTYSWVPPKYETLISSDGVKKVVIAEDGYWQKDYKTEKNAIHVAAYNYYNKDEVSSINITYNYIPNSYVITAEINHPAISYDCLITKTTEEIKYSYLLNGFEYDYYDSKSVSYEDGSYYGNVKLLDVNDTYTTAKVKLYKKNSIVNTSTVDTVEIQPAYVSYEYFSYKESTPLSNEKIPVLYKTELIPAKKKKVQYWDKVNNSYATKTVLTSYAYYAYSYTYEVVPLQVASYLYSDDLQISNFDDLGYYIDNIGYNISTEMNNQSNSINKMTDDLSTIFTENNTQNRTIADEEITTFSAYMTNVDNSIKEFNNNNTTSLSYLSTGLTEKLNSLTDKEEAAIGKLETSLVDEIKEQHNVIKETLTEFNNTVKDRFTSFEERYHSDVIGELSSEELETTYERTEFTPIIEPKSGLVSGYSYVKTTGSQQVKVGGDSIGEILQSTLGTVSTYSVTENNEDGSYAVTTYTGFHGIAEILANLSITNKIPKYEEFMINLVPKLFSSIDFDNPYDTVRDAEGNTISEKFRNPTDIAKKCIMRADVLWTELQKKGIVQ